MFTPLEVLLLIIILCKEWDRETETKEKNRNGALVSVLGIWRVSQRLTSAIVHVLQQLLLGLKVSGTLQCHGILGRKFGLLLVEREHALLKHGLDIVGHIGILLDFIQIQIRITLLETLRLGGITLLLHSVGG